MSTETALPAAPDAAPATAPTLPDFATLQKLTEEAVGHREIRRDADFELFIPTVNLAREVAQQLAAYGYCPQQINLGKGDTARRYDIMPVKWNTGRIPGRRIKHTGVVILRDFEGFCGTLLFDPADPNRQWSDDSLWAPKVGLPLQDNPFANYRMATAAELADWAHDALKVMTLVRDGERRRRERAESGLQIAEQALATL